MERESSAVLDKNNALCEQLLAIGPENVSNDALEMWLAAAATTPSGDAVNLLGLNRLETHARVTQLYPMSIIAWDSLTQELPRRAEPTRLLGEDFTRAGSAKRALELALKLHARGTEAAPQDLMDVNASIQCRMPLLLAPLWNSLGAAFIRDDETSVVCLGDGQSVPVSNIECYRRSLEVSTAPTASDEAQQQACIDNSITWVNLSELLRGQKRTVKIGSREFSCFEASVCAVAEAPSDVQAWYSLGESMSTHFNLVQNALSPSVTADILASIEAVNSSVAAHFEVTPVLSADSIMPIELLAHCFVTALRCDSGFARAWARLGNTLRSFPSGKQFVEVDDLNITRRLCAINAAALNSRNPLYLYEVIKVLEPHEGVELPGYDGALDEHALAMIIVGMLWSPNCEVEAVSEQHRMLLADCFKSLAFAHPLFHVKGRKFTSITALTEALRLEPRFGIAWTNLGAALHASPDVKTVKVNGKTYTRDACYAQAVEVWHQLSTPMPGESVTWTNLGSNMTRDATVVIRGVTMTKLDCLRKAVDIDRFNNMAWSVIGTFIVEYDVTLPDGFSFPNGPDEPEVTNPFRCFAIAAEIATKRNNRHDAVHHFFSLGAFLETKRCGGAGGSTVITFAGKADTTVTPSLCFARAVELNAANPMMWMRLAGALRFEQEAGLGDGTITVAGERLNAKQCLAKVGLDANEMGNESQRRTKEKKKKRVENQEDGARRPRFVIKARAKGKSKE